MSLLLTIQNPQGETIQLFEPGRTLLDLLATGGVKLDSACDGNGSCGKCLVKVKPSHPLPLTESECRLLSPVQQHEGWRLACQIKPTCNLTISVSRPQQQTVWRDLRADEFYSDFNPASTACLQLTHSQHKPTYGVAIDLGTTHIRLSLWNLLTRTRLAGRACLNPQITFGADVLTRLTAAERNAENSKALAELVENVIAYALTDISQTCKLKLSDIHLIYLVGNTAMLALLSQQNAILLLQPEYWTQRLPVQPQNLNHLRGLWGLSAKSDIRFLKPLGGFIGSDLVAGVVATQLISQPPGTLLIDFGTNSEMALWDGQKLWVTSTAGGPAFEGYGMQCGMPGEAGAIYRVYQDADESLKFSVLSDLPARGICGSGLVDLIAWLRSSGKLDALGRFQPQYRSGFQLLATQPELCIKPVDIDSFQRAKAAIGAGITWLCQRSGISLSSLTQVYACGAFGHLLDVENSIAIGLLPAIAPENIHLEGNTALAGCEMLMTSQNSQTVFDSLLETAIMHNLAEDSDFEMLFIENLYLQPIEQVA